MLRRGIAGYCGCRIFLQPEPSPQHPLGDGEMWPEIPCFLLRKKLGHRLFASVDEWREVPRQAFSMLRGTRDSTSSHQEAHQAVRSWLCRMRFDEQQQRWGDRARPNVRGAGRPRTERAHLNHRARHHGRALPDPRKTRRLRWEKAVAVLQHQKKMVRVTRHRSS